MVLMRHFLFSNCFVKKTLSIRILHCLALVTDYIKCKGTS